MTTTTAATTTTTTTTAPLDDDDISEEVDTFMFEVGSRLNSLHKYKKPPLEKMTVCMVSAWIQRLRKLAERRCRCRQWTDDFLTVSAQDDDDDFVSWIRSLSTYPCWQLLFVSHIGRDAISINKSLYSQLRSVKTDRD